MVGGKQPVGEETTSLFTAEYGDILGKLFPSLGQRNDTPSGTYVEDMGKVSYDTHKGDDLFTNRSLFSSSTWQTHFTHTTSKGVAATDGVDAKSVTVVPDLRNYSQVTATPFPDFVNIQNISDWQPQPQYPGWDNWTLCDWNNTFCLTDNSSDHLLSPNDGAVLQKMPNYWALLLLMFPMLTVFGNMLVVMSVYRERTLRTVTNYFIVSLAVADIMVAVLVMPLAVYSEVQNGQWELGAALCDTWVAFDVMCCTASILNLTAISVDRFIAVTQPIKYAKHKNSNRVYVMLGMTWVISVAISSPIALGMNYTEMRAKTPWMCIFYNADFLIYSSMGSFYIPCVVMIFLYWRIFMAIRMRTKKALKQKRRNLKCSQFNVIENKAQTNRTTSDASATEDSSNRELLPGGNVPYKKHLRLNAAQETSFTNFNAHVTTTDTTGEEENGPEMMKSPLSDDNAHVIQNDKSAEFLLSPASDDAHGEFRDGNSGYRPPSGVVVETQVSTVTSPTTTKARLSPVPPRSHPGFKNHAAKTRNDGASSSPKKSVTKFNFHLRHSKKKKEGLASKREKKATKTLAIVLGVFLFCWVPFFTINIIHAICIRYKLFARPECNLDPIVFSFLVWLGYINSFLNPVIYTIFNLEFRRAFKKILHKCCR